MTEPSGDITPSEGWKKVSPQPAEGAGPPMPGWVKPALAAGVAVLMLGGGLIGAELGDPGPRPGPSIEPTPTPTPAFALEPPVVVDDLVRGQVNESTGPAPANQQIVQADYTDGEHTVVLVLTWPEPNVADFLTNVAIEAAQETSLGSGIYCGFSEDTGESACAHVIDEVGILLASVTQQPRSAVAETMERIEEEMGQ